MSSTKDGPLKEASLNDILAVDDSTANLKLLEETLTAAGYRVRLANDGELALHSAMKQPPALVLLDIRMPGMDGYEVCRRLKANERTREVPVIFISILEDQRDKVKGFREGAVDYITKPFQPEEVLARIQTHLRLRELTESLEQKVAERTEELALANQLLRHEITERKKITEKEHLLSSIVESSDDAIIAKDLNGIILSWNDGAERIYGYSADETVGRSVSMLISPDNPDELPEIMAAIGRGERIEHYETVRLRKNGEKLFISLTVSPIRDGAGRIAGASAIARDISERKLSEEILKRMNEELEQRVKERTAELEAKNEELERMNRLFVGRELRMAELKERIRELERNSREGESDENPDS